MDRAIYTALSAASAALEKQAVTSNNLANASTPGFRAQLAAYRAVPINGPKHSNPHPGGGLYALSRFNNGHHQPDGPQS
jgi:flagellar basal body rod protein FlgF